MAVCAVVPLVVSIPSLETECQSLHRHPHPSLPAPPLGGARRRTMLTSSARTFLLRATADPRTAATPARITCHVASASFARSIKPRGATVTVTTYVLSKTAL